MAEQSSSIAEKVADVLKESSALSEREKEEIVEHLFVKGRSVKLRSISIAGHGEEYVGLKTDTLPDSVSLVVGPSQTGKTISYNHICEFFSGHLPKSVNMEVVLEIDGTEASFASQDGENQMKDICGIERYYHFVDQYGTRSSILDPRNKEELDTQDDSRNIMLAIQPGGSHDAERLLEEKGTQIEEENGNLKQSIARHLKEREDINATLRDLDALVGACEEALELSSNPDTLEACLKNRDRLGELALEKRGLETRIIGKRRQRSYLQSESSKFDQGSVEEILMDILKSMPCNVCGSVMDLSSEQVSEARDNGTCPVCSCPLSWEPLEIEAKERAERLASIRDRLFSLSGELSKLEAKLRRVEKQIADIGFSPSLSRIDMDLLDGSDENLRKLRKLRDDYATLASNQTKMLNNLNEALENEGSLEAQLQTRLSNLRETVEDMKATVRGDEEALLRQFVDLANKNLTFIRGEDDWFLAPEENRLEISRAVEEHRSTRLVKRKFTSPPPLLHEGLRLAVWLSVCLALIEIRAKSGTDNLSFMVLDSPESILTVTELGNLADLLEMKKLQVLLFTSRDDLGRRFKTVANLNRNPSVLSRKRLLEVGLEESEKSRLDYWGIWG